MLETNGTRKNDRRADNGHGDTATASRSNGPHSRRRRTIDLNEARARRGTSPAPKGTKVQTRTKAEAASIEAACKKLAFLPAHMAARFARRLPSHIELDDLVSAGSVGLVLAAQQHHDKPDLDLMRLAKQRIRGAILDYLRGVDHLTRRQRAAVSAFNRVKRSLQLDVPGQSQGQGEGNDMARIARGLGVTEERAYRIHSQLASVQIASFEESTQCGLPDTSPLLDAMGTEDGDRLRAALCQLPERLLTILSLYYCEDLTYKEIGDTLQISRSRICQLHTQAIDELRKRLQPAAA